MSAYINSNLFEENEFFIIFLLICFFNYLRYENMYWMLKSLKFVKIDSIKSIYKVLTCK
jgi:hypothetical protein